MEGFPIRYKALLASLMLATTVIAGCGTKPADPAPAAQTNASAQQQSQAPANEETKAPAATPAAAAQGDAYVAVTESSSAAYNVREKFLGKDLNVTAVGKTSTVSGEILLSGGVIQPSVVEVDLSTLKSDEDRRDNRVRQALDTAKHPKATFRITGAEGNPVLKDGAETAIKLQGNMTIKGTEKPLVFDAKAKLSGDTLSITATSTFAMTTFGVAPPNIANFVSVTDEVTLDVAFVGKKR